MVHRSLKPEVETEKWALPRRDFLLLGSAAVAGIAASSVTASTLSVVASPAAGTVLSVGFTDRTAPVAPESDATTAVPAAALRAGDAAFRRSGARVLVHGLTSSQHRRSDAVHLSTFAPVAEGVVPFLAWSHGTARNGATSTSPRTAFVAALDENGTLPVAIERPAAAGRWSRLFAAADVLPDLNALEQSGNVCRLSALRPGTYFVALRHSSADRQPDWRSIEVDWTSADAGIALRRHGQPVDFEYVTFTVDYPKA